MAAGSVSERALAALLTEVLEDRKFWAELSHAQSVVEPSPLLAERAADLYLATGTFLEKTPNLDPRARVAQAVGVLREIADFAAVASYARAKLAESGGAIPPRVAFEWLIRVDEVDDWAAGLGFRLGVSDGVEFPYETWPEGEAKDGEIGADDFPELWTVISDAYGARLDLFEKNPMLGRGWETAIAEGGPTIEQGREGAAEVLLGARHLLSWTRQNLPTDAEPVALAAVLITQSLFLVWWHLPEEGVLVPGPAYLSELLRGSDALDWLTEQGGEPPQWLT